MLQRLRRLISDNDETTIAVALSVFGLISGSLFYGTIGYLIFYYWHDIAAFVTNTPNYKAIIIVMAVLSGPFVYGIRTRWRIQYGMIEIAFGIFSIFTSVLRSTDANTSILQGLAGVYIVVRGLDNIQNGLKERPSYPLLTKVWKRFFPQPSGQKS